IFFVAKISKLEVRRRQTSKEIIFDVTGQLFFASVEGFIKAFDFNIADDINIVIDFSHAHIWDDSGVGAVDKVVIKYRENNNHVTIKGLNASSKKIIDKLAVYQDANAQLKAH
ncbi:STAS domain-containing protein, partial [Paenibacillus glucanolyticus]